MCKSTFAQRGFWFTDKPSEKKIELRYNEQLITSYCYFDSTEKPILYPIKTLSGVTITRGYPVSPRPGERTDHPHQVGLWLNYESVNGIDFWNNSFAIKPENKPKYGSIRREKVIRMSTMGDRANLITMSKWISGEGKSLITEETDFTFYKVEDYLVIDRKATLTADQDRVEFKDVKDGLLGLRVARELEMPSQQQDQFIDVHGSVTKVPKIDNEGVTGLYVNKEGLKGDSVWGKRSAWVCLYGRKNNRIISIAIIDHQKNPGYPTYWHARGYGLFAANPLGQKVFSKGKEELNFTLLKGEKATFQYSIVISDSDSLPPVIINNLASELSK